MALEEYTVYKEPDGATIRDRSGGFINDRGYGQYDRFLFPTVAAAVKHLADAYDYEVTHLGQEVKVRFR